MHSPPTKVLQHLRTCRFLVVGTYVRGGVIKMADVVAGAAGKAAMSMFGPHPSITIVTFWQGILEIVLRGVSILVAFICIIAAAVALDDLDYSDFDDLDDLNSDWDWEGTAGLARSACGFLIFVSIMVILLEGFIIALRFLNFGIVDRFTLIFHIVDIIISGVFAFLFFCLAISTAVYGGRFGEWEDDFEDDFRGSLGDAADLNEDMGGVSFFCFVGLFLFAGLAAFMGISIMLKWRNTQTKYADTPGALGGGSD